MQGITFLISFVSGLLVLNLKPVLGLGIYFIVLFWYPQYVTMKIGPANFNASRILILFHLGNLLFRPKLRKTYKFSLLDLLVLIQYFSAALALTANATISKIMVTQSGCFFDTILPYFSARMALRCREDYITIIKILSLIAIPMAILGFYECNTGYNPYEFFNQYDALGISPYGHSIRFHHFRAYLCFTVHILFGLFFAALAPLCLGLWRYKVWSKFTNLGVFFILLLGLFSAMSSAPWFSLVISLTFIAGFGLRKYWQGFALLLISMCIAVELYSNRHFWEVMDRFAMDGETAAYRNELIKEAFNGGMTGHWLMGYGYVGIHKSNDNSNFHWFHKDLVNIYIAKLATCGLLFLLPYLFFNILYYRVLYMAASSTQSIPDLWLIWCLSAVLVGWNVAFWSVSSFGLIETFHFTLIGFAGSLPVAVSQNQFAPVRAIVRSRPAVHTRPFRPLKVN